MRDPLDGPGFWIVLVGTGLIILIVGILLGWGLMSILTSTGPCPWLP